MIQRGLGDMPSIHTALPAGLSQGGVVTLPCRVLSVKGLRCAVNSGQSAPPTCLMRMWGWGRQEGLLPGQINPAFGSPDPHHDRPASKDKSSFCIASELFRNVSREHRETGLCLHSTHSAGKNCLGTRFLKHLQRPPHSVL